MAKKTRRQRRRHHTVRRRRLFGEQFEPRYVQAGDVGICVPNDLDCSASSDHAAGGDAKVTDVNGSMAHGGSDVDFAANSNSLTPLAGGMLNTSPQGHDSDLITNEDSTYTFQRSDFPFTDAEGDHLLSVKIGGAPSRGVLTLDGTPIDSFQQAIPATAIDGGHLVFAPLPVNAFGMVFSTLTFFVKDDGGTSAGGSDEDTTANTLIFHVLPVNDSPAGSDQNIRLDGGAARTFSLADFPLSDEHDAPANSLRALRIVNLPSAGTLSLNAKPVAAGQFIAAIDIGAGKLVFTPTSDKPRVVSFAFQVQDDGGTENGGVDLDPTPNTIYLRTLPNEPPQGADSNLTALEDQAVVIHAAAIPFSDPLDGEAEQLLGIRILSLPAAGTLRLFGASVVAGQFIRFDQLISSIFQFYPALNEFGESYAYFTYQVQDAGGTADGGMDLDPAPHTLTFHVTPVNDSPSFTAGPSVSRRDVDGLQIVVGWATSISAGPAGEGSQAPLLFEVVSNSNPALFEGSVTIDAGGDLSFDPAPNAQGTAQITIRLKDSGGTANGGVDTSATQTLSITIDKPYGWHNTKNPLDADGDEQITANDALSVINVINAFGVGRVPPGPPICYCDTVDGFGQLVGDNVIAAGDALAVINYINAFGAGPIHPPAGESAAVTPSSTTDDWLGLLAEDIAVQSRRRQ